MSTGWSITLVHIFLVIGIPFVHREFSSIHTWNSTHDALGLGPICLTLLDLSLCLSHYFGHKTFNKRSVVRVDCAVAEPSQDL